MINFILMKNHEEDFDGDIFTYNEVIGLVSTKELATKWFDLDKDNHVWKGLEVDSQEILNQLNREIIK